MIDSSGRRALRADGTVLDMLPVGRVVGTTGALLVALFVFVKPEASNGLGTAGRVLFWSLHVGLGLAVLGAVSRWLASRECLPNGALGAVLFTGGVAVVIAAPGYLVLDALFAPHVVDFDTDPAPVSIAAALSGEMRELGPWFLASWLLINLPLLLPRPVAGPRIDDRVAHDPTPPAAPTATSPRAGAIDVPGLRLVDAGVPTAKPTPQVDTRGERFLSSLPGVVGTDVIAVASDLHYLNVWTVAGRTTVLGTLKDVVADLGPAGMQVHRSHWVAHAHVRRIVGTASDASCILSNKLRVPISRRRWSAVREQYGRGVIHVDRPDRSAMR